MSKITTAPFYDLINEIINTSDFRKMQTYKHHLHGSTYEHSVRVAYLCYQHYCKHNSKVNLKELLRGALLHDYFLYDRHDKINGNHINGLIHCYTHPKRALENALTAYSNLTDVEQDTIKRHMFPLTPIPPRTRCGWLVCFYDKVAAVTEYCNGGKWNLPILCSITPYNSKQQLK